MKIGVLSKRTGLEATAIRCYEASGVLPLPVRLPSRYRDYTSEDEERIRFLARLRRIGLSVDDLRSLIALRDDPLKADPNTLGANRRAVEAIDECLDALTQLTARFGGGNDGQADTTSA